MLMKLGTNPVSKGIAIFIPFVVVGLAYAVAYKYTTGIGTPVMVALGAAGFLAVVSAVRGYALTSSAGVTTFALLVVTFFDELALWYFLGAWVFATLLLTHFAALRARQTDETVGYFSRFVYEFLAYQAILATSYVVFWHDWRIALVGFSVSLALLVWWAATAADIQERAQKKAKKRRR